MNGAAPKLIVEKITNLNPVSKNILRVLLYFDMFRHPLKAEEVFYCCTEHCGSFSGIENELNFLISQNLITKNDGYFFPEGNPGFVQRRMSGEMNARKTWKAALRFSKLISRFPFVRGVYISGSLSKGYMDKEADIDYFIVTKPGRLWLSRSLLVFFKKIFLLNSRKYFCVNYFIDENSLRIPDKNFFTATELVFLVPTCNYDLYLELMNRNSWVKKYYPNFPLRKDENMVPSKKSFIKNACESIFKGRIGEWLDVFFFRITISHWKRKFTHFDEKTFDLRLRSKKNVSKHHPKGFQEKILKDWEEKIDLFEMQHGVEIR
jgi:hypothetical protein